MSWLALSASFEYLSYGSTAIINILILSALGTSLNVRIYKTCKIIFNMAKLYFNIINKPYKAELFLYKP